MTTIALPVNPDDTVHISDVKITITTRPDLTVHDHTGLLALFEKIPHEQWGCHIVELQTLNADGAVMGRKYATLQQWFLLMAEAVQQTLKEEGRTCLTDVKLPIPRSTSGKS